MADEQTTTVGFNLEAFKTAFKGGARAYLFSWVPSFPSGVTGYKDAAYLVRSTSLPEDTVEEILVNWQGADFKMAGKRTFSDWTITLNCDRNSEVRQSFEDWVKLIHDVGGSNNYGEPSYDGYFTTQTLQMLGYSGEPINTMKLEGAWLKSIGAITLDYSSMDVAQFDITFTYQYHTFELEP
jgi:hypothetical protein